MDFFDRDLNAFFDALRKSNRERTLVDPQESGIDLCSNDYLCLSGNPELIKALKDGIDLYGAGSTASRLICGHREAFDELEQAFSLWVGSEAALFFANGYAANVGAISAICDGSYDAFIDRLGHASLVDGVRLSGAQKKYFHHNDLEHLEGLLAKSKASRKIIITESLFSMDGDFAPLTELGQLAGKYSALLYVDDAHAIGVYGKHGQGLAPATADFRMATFGKALGLEGAMIATTAAARKYLVHSARTFVFSTAPLPAVAYAGLTAIRLAKGMDSERQHIATISAALRDGARARGWSTGTSRSHIIPVICENEAHALGLAQKMQQAGLHIKAIRPPTVKESRLRISLNAGIEQAVISRILENL